MRKVWAILLCLCFKSKYYLFEFFWSKKFQSKEFNFKNNSLTGYF